MHRTTVLTMHPLPRMLLATAVAACLAAAGCGDSGSTENPPANSGAGANSPTTTVAAVGAGY